MKKNNITAKDLMMIGIFAAVIFICCMPVGMLGYIPIFIPLMTVLIPLLTGIPYMLFITKGGKFGMITILGVLLGLITGFGGMGMPVMITGPVFGLAADLLCRSGNYASLWKSVLSHGVFSMWLIGCYIPIVIGRAAYGADLISKGYGTAYVETLMGYVPDWSLLPLLAACFVFGLLGGWVGKTLLKKHFVRAGIA